MTPTRDDPAEVSARATLGGKAPRLGLALKAELVRAAVRHAGLRSAVVLVEDAADPGTLVVRAAWPDGVEGRRVTRMPGTIDRALDDGQTRVAYDLGTELGGLLGDEGGGIVAPITAGATVVGAIVGLVEAPSDAGDPAAAALLTTFARVIALEMALTDQQREANDARTRTDSLVDAGIALASEHDLEALLQRLVQTAREVLGARYAALGVLDPARNELVNFVTSGLDEQQRAAIGALPRGRGILGVLIRDARPLRLDRIADDPRSVGFPPHHPPMESFLGVPIALRGEVFGNLYLTEKVDCPFSEADERLALTLAAQAAVAIDGARRIEQERLRAAELESVQELAQAILATLDLEHLLPLVALRARNLTGAATVAVALREGDELAVSFAHGLGALIAESVRAPADPAALASRLAEALAARRRGGRDAPARRRARGRAGGARPAALRRGRAEAPGHLLEPGRGGPDQRPGVRRGEGAPDELGGGSGRARTGAGGGRGPPPGDRRPGGRAGADRPRAPRRDRAGAERPGRPPARPGGRGAGRGRRAPGCRSFGAWWPGWPTASASWPPSCGPRACASRAWPTRSRPRPTGCARVMASRWTSPSATCPRGSPWRSSPPSSGWSRRP